MLNDFFNNSNNLEYLQTTNKMRIAAKIQDWLIIKNITHQLFAKQLNLNQQQLDKLLSGIENYTIDQLTKICFILQIDIELLFEK